MQDARLPRSSDGLDLEAVRDTLGRRLVMTARLAVAAHLHASLSQVPQFGQRVVIGGAGPGAAGEARDARLDLRGERLHG